MSLAPASRPPFLQERWLLRKVSAPLALRARHLRERAQRRRKLEANVTTYHGGEIDPQRAVAA
jgi:hypothetical protein